MALRPWLPSDAKSATLAAWLDSSFTASLDLDTSGNVSEWRCRVGACKVTQSTASNRPGWSATGYNNLPAVLFTTDSQFLSGPALSTFPTDSAAGTMSGVAPKLAYRNTYSTMFYYGSANANKARSISATGESVSAGYYGNDVQGVQKWTGFTRIFITQISTTGLANQWVDGFAVQTNQKNPLSTPATSTLWVGRSINGDPWKDPIHEFHIWAGILSDAERDMLRGYMAWKWNKVADLDANDPYKTAAPMIDDGAGATVFGSSFTFAMAVAQATAIISANGASSASSLAIAAATATSRADGASSSRVLATAAGSALFTGAGYALSAATAVAQGSTISAASANGASLASATAYGQGMTIERHRGWSAAYALATAKASSVEQGIGVAASSSTAIGTASSSSIAIGNGYSLSYATAIGAGAIAARGNGAALVVSSAIGAGRLAYRGDGYCLALSRAIASGPPSSRRIPPDSRGAVIADTAFRTSILADTGARRVTVV